MASDCDPRFADDRNGDQGRDSGSIINLDKALGFTEGDHDVLAAVAQLFLEEGPKQLQDIAVRVDQGDCSGIRDAAHKLLGSVVVFGADRAAAAAQALEQAGATGALSEVAQPWATLQQEISRLMTEVEKLCRNSSAG